MNNKLGTRARQREVAVLMVIYEHEETNVPFFEIERHARNIPVCNNAQPKHIPFSYTLNAIARDLKEYGLIEITDDMGWSKCTITEQGKSFIETELS